MVSPRPRPGSAQAGEDADPRLVTLDLFSALLDSRAGGSAVFDRMASRRGWPLTGAELYDAWDARNKVSQRDTREWIPFAEHSRRALTATLAELGLDGAADDDVAELLDSVREWPLWPDVADVLPALARRWRVGVLSNVDDDLYARTRVAGLVTGGAPVIRPEDVLTSERLHAYKPAPEIYRRARDRAGGRLVHVATSARDVRGALEAGIPVVRLRRPGHRLDPGGPVPRREVAGLAELAEILAGDGDGGT